MAAIIDPPLPQVLAYLCLHLG